MPGEGTVHRLTLRTGPGAVAGASAWLRELARGASLGQERVDRLDLCASELLANVAEHAGLGPGAEVDVELELGRGTATFTVSDAGVPFDPVAAEARPRTSLEAAAQGGFGLLLARRFADGLRYERRAGNNRVTVSVGTEPAPLDAATVDAVSATRLFRDVARPLLEGILARCWLRPCQAGEVLLRGGEHHGAVLLGLEGRLEVHLEGPASSFHFDLGPGECVGELSVADGQPGSAWVRAAEACRLVVIPREVFLGSVLGVPQVVRNLIVVLSERMRRSNRQVQDRLRQALELEALQRELDVARQMQASMLPAAPLFPANPEIEARGFMRAARQVGGDFYEAFPLGEGRPFIAIGDVCGKGTPAALFMVRVLTLLRSEALRPGKDPERLLARLATRCSDRLGEGNEAQQFVSLFCALVDVARGRLHFVNGGHNPPLLVVPGSAPAFLVGPRNPLVGLAPGRTYHAGSVAFPPGSLVLLYTDGVTEAESASGSLFGETALQALLAGAEVPGADEAVARVVAAVDSFAGGQALSDDLTLLAVRRR